MSVIADQGTKTNWGLFIKKCIKSFYNVSHFSYAIKSVEWDQMTGPPERKMLCVTAVHSDQKNEDPEQISPLITLNYVIGYMKMGFLKQTPPLSTDDW